MKHPGSPKAEVHSSGPTPFLCGTLFHHCSSLPVQNPPSQTLAKPHFSPCAAARVTHIWKMEAAREGDLERLRLELPEGADAAQVNRKDEDGRTALHWAAANRPRAVNTHADCVRLLLRRGSKVNTHDDGGWTPIMSACSAGNAEVVRLLIDAQALVDEEEENSQVTPLHLAASKAHLDVVRELLQAGARAQMVDGLGQLPLHLSLIHI